MKTMRKVLALLLALTMALSLGACGDNSANQSPDTPDQTPANPTANVTPSNGEWADYYLSYNNLGSGVWILDFYAAEAQYFAEEVMGAKFSAPSANFTADQMKTDCQNLIASGINGHVYYGAFGTLTPVISDMFKAAKIPFSMADQIPTGEVMNQLLENPYFAGAVGPNAYDLGYTLGKLAAEMGYSKALIIAGAIGDLSVDAKVDGFTKAMEEGGGSVINVTRCASPAEASEKADDLISVYGADADCIFGTNADFSRAALNSMHSRQLSLQGFCTDIDNNMEDVVKSGEIIAVGGGAVCTSLSAALVVNYLDGHPILDADGKAPVFNDLQLFIIDKDNYDGFIANWINSHPITKEAFEGLLYRYNSDVDYQTWRNFITNYNYETISALH